MYFDHFAYRYISGRFEHAFISTDSLSDELVAVSVQERLVRKNIESFMAGGPALNMLLWGEKGSGKSTLLRQTAYHYGKKGLVTVEFMDETHGAIYALYRAMRETQDKKFLLYFDDISFDDGSAAFRRFKSSVEGGLEDKPANVLFAATSNKRHIVSDKAIDTTDIYDRDEMNDRTSLEARFGLSLGFYVISKDDYLKIAKMYLDKYKVVRNEGWEREAEAYAIDRGGRSGRLAKQFAAYMAITEGGSLA